MWDLLAQLVVLLLGVIADRLLIVLLVHFKAFSLVLRFSSQINLWIALFYSGYNLLYSTDSRMPLDSWGVVTLTPGLTSYRLGDLQANTRYYLMMSAYNSAGYGPFTETTSAITDSESEFLYLTH